MRTFIYKSFIVAFLAIIVFKFTIFPSVEPKMLLKRYTKKMAIKPKSIISINSLLIIFQHLEQLVVLQNHQ